MSVIKTNSITIMLAALFSVGLAAQSVTVPYSNDFSGAIGSGWTQVITGPGQILLGAPPTNSPGSGGDALLFDGTMQAVAYVNEAHLSVDMAGASGFLLSYWAREASDEADAADGLFLSDGVQTVLVFSHQALTSTWIQVQVDIGNVLASNGMLTGGIVELIFSQADNYPIPTDGLIIDDVSLLPPPSPDFGQSNQANAVLDINAAMNLNQHRAVIGENGPFFASGNIASISIEGPTSWPFALIYGPLNRNNATFAGIGNLDIGLLGQGNYGDLIMIMDGGNPVGFFDYFAFTDVAGTASLTFDLTGLPPGVLGTFQALIYQPASPFVKLTAAFEYSLP